MIKIPADVSDIIKRMRQAEPCFQHVRWGGSLHLGFGEKSVRVFNGHTLTRAEWQIGSYYNNWVIRSDGGTICGHLLRDQTVEGTAVVEALKWSGVSSIEMISKTKAKFEFVSGLSLEIFGNMDQDDQMFHIFYPPRMVVKYQCDTGWLKGRSDEGWSPTLIV